jgi:hypothetical protein
MIRQLEKSENAVVWALELSNLRTEIRMLFRVLLHVIKAICDFLNLSCNSLIRVA